MSITFILICFKCSYLFSLLLHLKITGPSYVSFKVICLFHLCFQKRCKTSYCRTMRLKWRKMRRRSPRTLRKIQMLRMTGKSFLMMLPQSETRGIEWSLFVFLQSSIYIFYTVASLSHLGYCCLALLLMQNCESRIHQWHRITIVHNAKVCYSYSTCITGRTKSLAFLRTRQLWSLYFVTKTTVM